MEMVWHTTCNTVIKASILLSRCIISTNLKPKFSVPNSYHSFRRKYDSGGEPMACMQHVSFVSLKAPKGSPSLRYDKSENSQAWLPDTTCSHGKIFFRLKIVQVSREPMYNINGSTSTFFLESLTQISTQLQVLSIQNFFTSSNLLGGIKHIICCVNANKSSSRPSSISIYNHL